MKLSMIALTTVCRSLAVFFLLVGSTAQAETLSMPTNEVVLTVSGQIERTNGDDSAQFDLAMLRALPRTGFSTSTIWTEGERRFDGVSLAALLKAIGAQGSRIVATALNDYSIEIPVQEMTSTLPIIAYELDGEEMSVREKGPLWIVYPYDSDSRYRSEKVYARSIWQLNRIEVID